MADIRLLPQIAAAPDLSVGVDESDYDVWAREQFPAPPDASVYPTEPPTSPFAQESIAAAIVFAAALAGAPLLGPWQASDTSQSSFTINSPPPVVAPTVPAPPLSAPQQYPWLPADTSQRAFALTSPPPAVVETVPRAPLRVRVDRQYETADTSLPQPLTLRDVVVVAPFVPAVWAAPPALMRAQADSSRSTPLPLLVVAPVSNPPLPAPDALRRVVDTSRGTPKPLIADAQAPVFNPPWTPPDALRPVVDTSQKQPITLQVIVAPAPIANVPGYAPYRFWWQPPDTSAGTAKPLYADAQLPFVAPPTILPERVRPVSDTTQGFVPQVVAAPPGATSYVVTPRYAWLGPDTSAGTPKPLVPDAQLPFRTLLPGLLPADWTVTDTSQGTSPGLRDIVAPVGQATLLPPQRALWQPASETRGSPKGLISDAQPPVSNLQHTAPDRVRPVTDTSQSAWPVNVVILPLPPGQTAYVAAPRAPWTNPDTTLESPPVAIQGVEPAPPQPPVVDITQNYYGKYDPDLERRVLEYWERQERLRKTKPGFPETKKKKREPLPDASPEAKAPPPRDVVADAERALASLKPRVHTESETVLSNDELALLLLLLEDEDDD